jgi:hypothetical protein
MCLSKTAQKEIGTLVTTTQLVLIAVGVSLYFLIRRKRPFSDFPPWMIDELDAACDRIAELTSALDGEKKAAESELQMRLAENGKLRVLWHECLGVLRDVQGYHPRDPKNDSAPPVIDLLKRDRPDIYTRLVTALLREEDPVSPRPPADASDEMSTWEKENT